MSMLPPPSIPTVEKPNEKTDKYAGLRAVKKYFLAEKWNFTIAMLILLIG